MNPILPIIDEEQDNNGGVIRLSRADETNANADDSLVSSLTVNLMLQNMSLKCNLFRYLAIKVTAQPKVLR
jgi:hypothetical protein